MIILFNPRSTTPGKQPLPLSLLSLAAVLDDETSWRLIDGNLERDSAGAILACAATVPAARPVILAVTVMPGPQVTHAVEVCRRVRAARPDMVVVWGGYFPTQHADTVLASPLVDFVVRSQGERAFLDLIQAITTGGDVAAIGGVSWKREGRVVHNPAGPMWALDDLPDLPYDRVPMERYLHRNYLGRRTAAYHSSFGCPFACAFCAVVAMSRRRWLHQSPPRMAASMTHLVRTYGVDAVQMHDMDFFISEERAAEFAHRIADLGLHWWALGRVDRLVEYSDATWRALARSGLKMVFSGAESGSDAQLAAMNKGGRSSTGRTLALVRRMRDYGIIPELSFVIGNPPDPLADFDTTRAFIRAIKRINPATEIVLYAYTPVPAGTAMFEQATALRFRFPETLDEWASPAWQQLSMRRGDGLPWVTRAVRTRVRNFERVLNAFYPTTTTGLGPAARTVLRGVSAWRYLSQRYEAPYELRVLQRLIRYQRPETTGF